MAGCNGLVSINQWTGFCMISASVMKGLIILLIAMHSVLQGRLRGHLYSMIFILFLSASAPLVWWVIKGSMRL